MLGHALPATIVIVLQLWCIERLLRRADHLARLEHERHGAVDQDRRGRIGAGGLLEGGRIRAVPGVRNTETFMYLKLAKQTYSWGVR